MHRLLLLVSLLQLGSSQLLRMTACSDLKCTTNCVSWNPDVGTCSTCDKGRGVCSLTNPSSITTSSTITFYSDAVCSPSAVVPGYANIPIRLNNECNTLVSSGVTVGSYRAADLSLSIGLSVAFVLTTILVSVCCCWRFKCCCFRSTGSTGPTVAEGLYPPPPPPPPTVYALPTNYGDNVAYPQQMQMQQQQMQQQTVAYPYNPNMYGYPQNTTYAYNANYNAYPQVNRTVYPPI